MPEQGGLRCAYRRYIWPESRFSIRLEDPSALAFRLIARSPDLAEAASASLKIEVNGQCCASRTPGCRWTRIEVSIPLERLQARTNLVTLHWPIPSFDATAKLEHTIERLEQGRAAPLHPVYGELAHLTLVRAG